MVITRQGCGGGGAWGALAAPARSVLCHSLVVYSIERECCLNLMVGGLQSNANRFKVHAAALACALY